MKLDEILQRLIEYRGDAPHDEDCGCTLCKLISDLFTATLPAGELPQ